MSASLQQQWREVGERALDEVVRTPTGWGVLGVTRKRIEILQQAGGHPARCKDERHIAKVPGAAAAGQFQISLLVVDRKG
jgi:hypothetical protein